VEIYLLASCIFVMRCLIYRETNELYPRIYLEGMRKTLKVFQSRESVSAPIFEHGTTRIRGRRAKLSTPKLDFVLLVDIVIGICFCNNYHF
jgi:hypothetical protein